MLSGEQVLQLIEAGFSAEEIRAYNGGPAPAEAEKTDSGTTQSDVSKEESPAPPEPDPAIAALTSAVKGLQDTVAAIQKANLRGAQMPDDKRPTADDAIRNFFKGL